MRPLSRMLGQTALAIGLSGCAAADVNIARDQARDELQCKNLVFHAAGDYTYRFEGCGASATISCREDITARYGWSCYKQ